MNIDDLCGKVSKKSAVHLRYPADKVSCYEADLRRVVELEKQGQPRPSYSSLVNFFKSEYGIEVVPSTVRSHFLAIQKGGTL